ncbi:MAG: COG1470 family protein [Thermoleophilia bacterium]
MSLDSRREDPQRAGDKAPRQRSLRVPSLALSLAAAAALTLVFFAEPARAGFSVEIAPAQIEITLEPGADSGQTIGIRNHDTAPVDLKVFVRDFELTAEGGFEMREPGDTTYSAGRWLDFPVATLRLDADETRILDYSIHVPESAESGGHYAAIIFEGASADFSAEDEGAQVSIVGQVVAEVLITVPGPITRNLVVDSLTVPMIAFGAGSDYADVTVRNTGNVHLTPNGYVQTWGGLPTVSFDKEFGRFTVLPGGLRRFRVPLENLPWLGRMRAKTELKYGPSIDVFNRSVETAVDYFVVSWKVILILDLLLIGFDLVLLREWRRRVAARRATPAAAQNSARTAAQDTAS